MEDFWTVVDQGFDVEVYETTESVANLMYRRDLCIRAMSDDPSTLAEIAHALNTEGVVRFYETGESKWSYRAQQQFNVK